MAIYVRRMVHLLIFTDKEYTTTAKIEQVFAVNFLPEYCGKRGPLCCLLAASYIALNGRAALAVSEICLCSVLFDTTSRTVGRLNEPAPGSAHRESHPSEDLSELPPLLAAVAGQDVPL